MYLLIGFLSVKNVNLHAVKVSSSHFIQMLIYLYTPSFSEYSAIFLDFNQTVQLKFVQIIRNYMVTKSLKDCTYSGSHTTIVLTQL